MKAFLKVVLKIAKWFGLIIALLVVATTAFIMLAPTFGGTPDANSQAIIAESKNYNGEIFVNRYPTKVETRSENSPSWYDSIMGFLNPSPDKNPNSPLPTQAVDKQSLKEGSFIWLGHSTVLFKTGGKTIITDPVFHAGAPVSFAVKPFPMTNVPKIADLPFLDAVLISHDHYDHLDYQAIKKLKGKVAQFYVPLGIKAHLQRWGIANEQITELDWYNTVQVDDLELILTPARHFSGRGLLDRSKTLWSSWVVKSQNMTVYFSGDGGYSPDFKIIGDQYGPFDMAFLEDGAYNEDWEQIHMLPEQAAQAAVDLRASVLLPIHWSKFDLALHPWQEPIERISSAVKQQNKKLVAAGEQPMKLASPMIGQTFSLDNVPNQQWWKTSNQHAASN